MVQYDLSHLTQDAKQLVCGPIQDDEALFLYSLVRSKRMTRILEVGGLSGYSAANFLKAIEHRKTGAVYTVEMYSMTRLSDRHKCITKDARSVTPEDVDGEALDLVFFDCHDFIAELHMYFRLKDAGIITDHTVLAMHDTNLHYAQFASFAYPVQGGFVHQPAERKLANIFKDMGYDVFCLHTRACDHDEDLPYRHGLTVCQKFDRLVT